jgi:hypothetical protein
MGKNLRTERRDFNFPDQIGLPACCPGGVLPSPKDKEQLPRQLDRGSAASFFII